MMKVTALLINRALVYNIKYCYNSSRSACMPLVEIAPRDVHSQWCPHSSRDTSAFVNIHVCQECPH